MPAPMLSLASFFTIEARDYQNFSFDADARTMVRNLILAFCIGILLAALYSLYQKQVPGAIVRAILREKALSPGSAKTAEELGISKNPLMRYELQHNTVLKRLVHTVGEEKDQTPPQSSAPASETSDATPDAPAQDIAPACEDTPTDAPACDPDPVPAQDPAPTRDDTFAHTPARYYIPEELKYRAETRFDTKGSGPFSILLTICVTIIIGVALIRFLPGLLGIIDNLMN